MSSVVYVDCVTCGRPTRPSGWKAGDHPGTISRGAKGECISCYAEKRPRPGQQTFTEVTERPSALALAVIPERVLQQSDCRSSCCKTPYMCATSYRCGCHLEGL